MNRCLNATTFAVAALAAGAGCSAETPARPNIIVIVTDDQGRGDLSLYRQLPDIHTPHLDRLARQGVNFTAGYVTAPQCAPSRAGLLTGRYQQRIGLDSIPDFPMPTHETTIADRLRTAGYTTCMIGKWHMEPNVAATNWAQRMHPELLHNGRIAHIPHAVMEPYYPAHFGFDWYYANGYSPYYVNFDLHGSNTVMPRWEHSQRHRIEEKNAAALAFVRQARAKPQPFFLYLAYYAPHVPLNAPRESLARFPGEMPERRRHGLAFMAMIDDGVGALMRELEQTGLARNTLVFFISDNGAPLGAQTGALMRDVMPADHLGGAWDGSRNDPFRGEKGMLAEGGIRVPFIMSWPARTSAGVTYDAPVSALDITATAIAAAGLPAAPELDGTDLLPYVTRATNGVPHACLYWRFWGQAAIRCGRWKYLQLGGERRLLFDLESDPGETKNVAAAHPRTVRQLEQNLAAWASQMQPPGVPSRVCDGQENDWYNYFFPVPPP